MTDEPMAYAARYPGEPGYSAVSVDLPGRRHELAQLVARWIRRGAIVERVTLAQATEALRVQDEAVERRHAEAGQMGRTGC